MIFTLPFLLMLVSFANFVSASGKKRVSFQNAKPVATAPTKEKGTLIEAISSSPFGEELMSEILLHYGIEDAKDLTDCAITKFWVSEKRTLELSFFTDNLVVDEEVLEAFRGVVADRHLYEANFVLQALPALASQDSLAMMARDVRKFETVLHLISRFEPAAFVAALPAIREALQNDQEYMDLVWICVRMFSFAANSSESKRDRKHCFQKLAIEFLNCTKFLPFTAATEILSLPFEAKEILLSLAIELGCVDFLRLLISLNVFGPRHRFESGVVSGNAFMLVRGNTQVLQLLIDTKVPLEDLISSRRSKNGRVSVISIFTYLFLQGNQQMNEILMSLEYTRATYMLIARESIRYNVPEIATFALSRCEEVQEILVRAEQEKRQTQVEKRGVSDIDYIPDEEVIEDSGHSHHGF